MKPPRRQFLHLASRAAAVSVVFGIVFPSGNAWSQTRTIKLMVPYPPGGAVDAAARLLAEEIGKASGSTITVEDRPGAASMIGTEAASRAAPNGNTLLIASSAFVIAPHVRKLNYNPLTSFESICSLVSSPSVIVVNNASPHRTLADLLSAARMNPGRVTMAAAGPATAFQIAFEMLKRDANVDMTFVPFPGSPPAVNALLGEHVTSALSDYAVVAEQIKAGRPRRKRRRVADHFADDLHIVNQILTMISNSKIHHCDPIPRLRALRNRSPFFVACPRARTGCWDCSWPALLMARKRHPYAVTRNCSAQLRLRVAKPFVSPP
jgi:Tripartite tricarboxylate transporter family receptor